MASSGDRERKVPASLCHFNDEAAYDGIRFYLEKAVKLTPDDVTTILADECKKYPDSWSAAEKLYSNRKKEYKRGWTKEHCLALTCYTLRTPGINKRFKAACRSAFRSEENWNNFCFKGLLCLFADAFQLLPHYEGETKKFYRGIPETETFVFDEQVSEGQKVRFPHFVSASYSRYEASKFAGQGGSVLTLDGVPAEFVRNIKDFSVYKYHEEVLIWPLCTFTCVNKTKKCLEFLEAEPLLAKKIFDPVSRTACPDATKKE